MQKHLSSALLSLTLVACAGPGSPIPVTGDAYVLAGEWTGEYSSNETGRAGSILFTLQAGSDTAMGDVLMIPNRPNPYGISQYSPNEDPPRSTELLRIHLVRIFGQQVAGRLSPYTDPDCGCELTTIFSGRLQGDTLEGVFHSYHEDGRIMTGVWRVQRKAPKTQAEE